MTESALMQLAQAQQMLEQATTLPEIRQVRDLAKLAGEYARAARLGRDAQNEAGVVRLEAEAKAGDLLDEMAARGERAGEGQPTTAAGGSRPPNLATLLGTTTKRANHEVEGWRRVALVPKATRQDYYDALRSGEAADNEVVTRRGLLRWAEYYATGAMYEPPARKPRPTTRGAPPAAQVVTRYERVDEPVVVQAVRAPTTRPTAPAGRNGSTPPPPQQEDAYDDDYQPTAGLPACTHSCPRCCKED